MSDNILTLDFANQLKLEGINCKGFGIIPKFVMLDQDLTLDSRTIYAYLASFAGSGNTTFPRRSKILADLQISKDAFYKHFGLLIKHGYISVHQQKGMQGVFGCNIYTIISNPKKLAESRTTGKSTVNGSMLRTTGLKALGFGTIPKAVMVDRRLPRKAKGIYAYLCSFAGAGNTAFPSVDHMISHLQISRNTYHKYLALLVKLDYLTVLQRRIDGKLSVNDYYLNDTPDMEQAALQREKTPCTKKQDTVKITTSKKHAARSSKNLPCTKIQDTVKQITPCTKIQDTVKQDTKKSYTVKQDTINNSISINSITNNSSINHQELPEKKTDEGTMMEERKINAYLPIKGKVRSFFSVGNRRNQLALTVSILGQHKCGINSPTGQMIMEAIADMTTEKNTGTYMGTRVSSNEVCEKLNTVLQAGADEFQKFFDVAATDLQRAIDSRSIANLRGYAKSVVWTVLLTYRMRSNHTAQASAQSAVKRGTSYDLEAFEQAALSGLLMSC